MATMAIGDRYVICSGSAGVSRGVCHVPGSILREYVQQ